MLYKLFTRSPLSWKVCVEGKTGIVKKTGDSTRSKRWRLYSSEGGEESGQFFPSRRAAFLFFETGETFKTNPVFEVIGGRRSQKRVR